MDSMSDTSLVLEDFIVEDFLNLFHDLTKSQKKIFKFLQYMARNCRSVFPSVETISKHTKCSISTVVRATNYFQRMRWICKMRRCYRSNKYFMCEVLMKLNLNDSKTFRPNISFDMK